MIFQTYSLLERSNVFDNVAFPMKIWNFDEKTISDKVWSMIELVGLTDKANNYPRELSGGQKQRVAIARSLVMNPKYILSDESTSALDPNTAQSILYLLKKINKELNITILIVAHQMEVIRQTCDRMAILKGGKISVNDTVKNVFLRQPTELKQLMGDTDAKYVPGKVFLRVYVPEKEEYSVFFYKLARETGVEFCLEAGGIKLFREGPAFLGMISVEHGNIKKVLNFLDITGIDYEVINDGI